jgi:hypothetical protein
MVASAGTASPQPSRDVRWLVALLGAAWLVPLALHGLRLDVIEPALLLLAVASIMRSGTNLVDRLVLAAVLLVGAALSLGLVFSVWPWGLQPVPVAGTMFSLIVAAGWLTGRRPCLPRRMLGSDVVVLGSGVFAFLAAYAPVAGLPALRWFTFSATAEDRYAHFALFDTIRRLGGYAFLHQKQAVVALGHPTEIVYPSGSHFLYAMFDTLLGSTVNQRAPLAEFNRYFVYVLLAYAFLIMTLVWAARWIAGPLTTRWRRIFICSVVAALAIGGPFVIMIEDGFDSEIAGLAFLALAVAVSVRPPRVVREQVLIACAALVAVACTYNLYAPMIVLGLLTACVVYHRRLRQYWRFSVVCAVVACAVAFYQSALSLLSGFNAQAQTLTGGKRLPVSLPLLLMLALLIVATMAGAVLRRLAACRMMAAQVAVAAAVVIAFGAYQIASRGHTSYYYDKLLMAGYVVCLIGLGSVSIALRRLPAPSRPRGSLTLLREVPLALAAAVVALNIVAVSQWGMRSVGGGGAAWRRTPLTVWNAGNVTALTGRSMTALARAHLLGDGVPSLVLYSDLGIANWRDSFLDATFNRDLGEMKKPIDAILHARVGGPPLGAAVTRAGLRHVLVALRESPFRVRLVVWEPTLARELEKMIAANPDVRAAVLVLGTLRS